MPSSTWTWIGNTGSASISANWTLTAGADNPQHLPQPGDTSIIDAGTAVYLDPSITGGSTIELTGSGAAQLINDSIDAANAAIDATSTIDAAGTATVLQIQGPVTNNGVIEVTGTHDSLSISIASNGSIVGDLINSNTGTILVDQGDTLSITGTGEFTNGGSLDVIGGSAVIASLLLGVGAYAVNSGGTLEFAQQNVGATEVVDMAGGAGTMKLDHATAFSGSVHNFVIGDRIDVGPVNVATLTYDGSGHLQLFDSGGTLLFTGSVTGAGGSLFQIGSFPVGQNGGVAGGFRVSQSFGGDAVVSVQGPSTWTWFGGIGSMASAADWSLSAGPGNPSGVPGIGDTALVNAGTMQARDTQFNANTIVLGSATGQFSNDTTLLRTAVFDSATTIESTASAVSSVLQAFGLVLNDGSVLAAAAGGSFTLSAQQFIGGSLLPGLFVNAGDVGASNGNTLTIATGANAAFANVGSVLADGGTVRATGSLADGNGVWAVKQNGTLEVGAAPGSASFVFDDDTGTLKLDHPALFGGAILGFRAGDAINLGHVTVGTIAYDGTDGALTLINAGSTVASLRVSGNFEPGTFVANGGTAGSFALGTDVLGNTILTTTTVQPVSWTFGSDDWSVTADWSSKSLPGSNDTALFGPSGSSRTITINNSSVSAGTLLMEDVNTNLQVNFGLTVAGSVEQLGGTIAVATGAQLTAQSLSQIGDASNLTFSVAGNFALAALTGALDIADPSAGPVGLIDVGSVTVARGTLDAGGQTTPGATGGYIVVGMDGSPTSLASMNVQSGGVVFATYTRVDSDVTSAGTLSISDAGSHYTDVGDATDAANTRGYMLVGVNSGSLTPIGGATLNVANGATLTETSYAEIGANVASSGTVSVASGAQWRIGLGSGQPGFLVVGDEGSGTLTIGDLPGTIVSGGTVAVGGGGTITSGGTKIVVPYAVDIGRVAGASGSVAVSGSGALLTAQSDVRVGDAGTGSLTVSSGGVADIATGSLIIGGGNGGSDGGVGVVALASGGSLFADGNLLVWQGSTVSVDAKSSIDLGSSGSLTVGAIRIEAGHSLVGAGLIEASLINSGQIIASTSSLPSASIGGKLEITGSVTGSGGIILGSGTSLQLDSSVAVTQSVTFVAGAPETLIIGAPGTALPNPLQNLFAGDRIEFGGGMVINSASFAAGTITVNTGSGPYLLKNVGFAPGVLTNLTTGIDVTTGDAFIEVQQRTLSWTGNGGDGGFGTAANWQDLTNSLATAVAAPGLGDIAEFVNGGGIVHGNGQANTLEFGNGPWTLTAGATLADTAGVTVGLTGTGTVAVTGGARISSAGLDEIGAAGGQSGTATVAGLGSVWNTTGRFVVGAAGQGMLSVATGGTVSAQQLELGAQAGGIGTVAVDGVGSQVSVTGSLVAVGEAGKGALALTNGGQLVTGAASLIIGGSGTASVGGASSLLSIGGSLSVGGKSGGGVLDIATGGTAQVGTGIDVGGSVALSGGNLATGGMLTVEPGAHIAGFGTVGATLGLVDNGTIEASVGLLLDQAPLSGSGILLIDQNATLAVGSMTGGNAVSFANAVAGATLILNDPGAGLTNAIANLQNDDIVEFAGLSIKSVSITSPGTVTVVENGGPDYVLGNIGFAAGAVQGFVTGHDAVTGNDFIKVACFLSGTHISAEHGDVVVEALRVGDRVRVVIGAGELDEVVWIGHRRIDCRRQPKPSLVWPVRVAAGAFGSGRPRRDVWLSPDHAILVVDTLIPVKHLINGSSIVQVPLDAVSYYHVELSRHSVLLAEGLPVESYLDVGDRTSFENGGGPIALYPDFASRMWEAGGCAPLVVTGEALEAARCWVNALAAGARLRRKAA